MRTKIDRMVIKANDDNVVSVDHLELQGQATLKVIAYGKGGTKLSVKRHSGQDYKIDYSAFFKLSGGYEHE